MLREYAETLDSMEPKIDARLRGQAILAIRNAGTQTPRTHYTGKLLDDGDRPFVEVAITGGAVAVITWNVRDFPADRGFEIWTPEHYVTRIREAR